MKKLLILFMALVLLSGCKLMDPADYPDYEPPANVSRDYPSSVYTYEDDHARCYLTTNWNSISCIPKTDE